MEVDAHNSASDNREENEGWKEDQRHYCIEIGPVVRLIIIEVLKIEQDADKADDVTLDKDAEKGTPEEILTEALRSPKAELESTQPQSDKVEDVEEWECGNVHAKSSQVIE